MAHIINPCDIDLTVDDGLVTLELSGSIVRFHIEESGTLDGLLEGKEIELEGLGNTTSTLLLKNNILTVKAIINGSCAYFEHSAQYDLSNSMGKFERVIESLRT